MNIVPAVAAGDFANPLLEAVLRFVRPRPPVPVVKLIAQEPTGFQRGGAAFGAVGMADMLWTARDLRKDIG